MTAKFEVGSKVCLIDGGPEMLVNAIQIGADGDIKYSCVWSTGDDVKSNEFAEALLTAVTKKWYGSRKMNKPRPFS